MCVGTMNLGHPCEQSVCCFQTSTGQVVGFAELGDLDDAILEWEAGDALAGVPGATKPLACEASISCPLLKVQRRVRESCR